MRKWHLLNIFGFVLLFLLPLSASAEVTRAVIAVDGMSCPFCAFGVEKRLKTVSGTADVTVMMAKGTATLVAGAGESLAVGQIDEAVRKAGFTPGQLRVTAIGGLQQGPDGLLLQMNNSSLLIQTNGLSAQQKNQLDVLRTSGRSVRLSGILEGTAGEHPVLTPDKIEEVEP